MKQPVIIVGERLRAAREIRKLSVSEVATKAQLKTQYLSRIEEGRDINLTMAAYLRWCAALGMQPGQALECLPAEKRMKP